ncbi:MAG: hypothetical protein H6834_11390 [Planctomycetes bacterium]|nr:hypothetical protein [Planctomycetota bacterium]
MSWIEHPVAADAIILLTSTRSWYDVLTGMRDDPGFVDEFVQRLTAIPWKALRFETPRLTRDALDTPFECALLASPELERSPDPTAFAPYFARAPLDDVLAFPNLGGDAHLIVPALRAESCVYAHLLAFLRGAPHSQVHALFSRTSEELLHLLEQRPVWLNTAGAGVPWLHVRLDARPKYYRWRAYREE